ncbi:MAG TPA: acetylxylan esterase [archaeon]|nr:acetylxylan esterase [archaeon]
MESANRIFKKHLTHVFFLLVFLFLKASPVFPQDEDFNLLTLQFGWNQWRDQKNMLLHHIHSQAFRYLDLRDRGIAALKTQEDWEKRQAEVREILMRIVGPFPEKTPLKARIMSKVQRAGFSMEKIVYESMPGFYVTACLFIPDGLKGKTPAILYVLGHSDISFRSPHYQHIIYNLVRKGFIVFSFDPVSQGERFQYYDPEKGDYLVGNSENEHDYFGRQCFISGVSSARYFIWDGIRAIDYLLTRKEVDPERIGVTGISGGGTQTTYIAAFDQRVRAAAPACYISGFRKLLQSVGADDAEQNFYHGLSSGTDHGDLIELMAPKPYLIVATTRDWFSIQGARETFREARGAYRAFGKEENLQMVEDDHGHGYTRKNREAIYAFFQKTLDFPGDPAEEDVEILEPEALNVTPTGQLVNSLGGETVFSINKRESEALIQKIEASRKNPARHLDRVLAKARELSGYLDPQPEKEPLFRGRYRRVGYSIEMYLLSGEQGNYVVPLLVFVPDGQGKFPALVYLHPEGKTAEAAPGANIEKLVRRGVIVASTDLIGTGETEYKSRSAYFGAVLIGRSIVGIQAGDIVRVVDFLKNRSDVNRDTIGAVAVGETAPALLHAAAFEPSIKGVALLEAPVSYRSIVMSRFYDWPFSSAVAGALTAYDLPDLAGLLCPRKLLFLEPKDARKQPALSEMVNSELSFPRSVYTDRQAAENIKVLYTRQDDYIYLLADWLFD